MSQSDAEVNFFEIFTTKVVNLTDLAVDLTPVNEKIDKKRF